MEIPRNLKDVQIEGSLSSSVSFIKDIVSQSPQIKFIDAVGHNPLIRKYTGFEKPYDPDADIFLAFDPPVYDPEKMDSQFLQFAKLLKAEQKEDTRLAYVQSAHDASVEGEKFIYFPNFTISIPDKRRIKATIYPNAEFASLAAKTLRQEYTNWQKDRKWPYRDWFHYGRHLRAGLSKTDIEKLSQDTSFMEELKLECTKNI